MIDKARSVLEGRFRLSAQMYVGVGGAVLLTLSASLVAWVSFDRIGDATNRVREQSVPEMVASFGIAQYTGVLAAAAPRLTSAVTTSEFEQVSQEIQATTALFEQQLESLSSTEHGGQQLVLVRQYAAQLIQSIDTIETEKKELLELDERTTAISIQLAILQQQLDEILIPAIDDQLFYTMTGYSDLGDPPVSTSEHFSETEFYRYRNVADLQAAANTATQLLASAFTVSDAAFIEPLRERAEAARSRIERSLSVLRSTSYAPVITLIFNRLFDLSLGEQGGFELLAREHELTSRQHDLLDLNRQLAVLLVDEVDGLVEAAEFSVSQESNASEQSILQGRLFLLGISAMSIVGRVPDCLAVCGQGVVATYPNAFKSDAAYGGRRPRNGGRDPR